MDALRIAMIGGTGPQGRGLGRWLAAAGHDVVIGSRDADRARSVADELDTPRGGRGNLSGATNREAVDGADLVTVTVPYGGQAQTLRSLPELDGRIVVSCVNPLEFDDRGPYPLPVPGGSAAEEAAALLPGARVVAAFHHLSATVLIRTDTLSDESVMVAGDDEGAKAVVCELARAVAGRGGVDAGPLRNARQLEALTAVLIDINRTYRAHTGIAVTGL